MEQITSKKNTDKLWRLLGTIRSELSFQDFKNVMLKYCADRFELQTNLNGEINDFSFLISNSNKRTFEKAKLVLDKLSDNEIRDLMLDLSNKDCLQNGKFSQSSSKSLSNLIISLLNIRSGDLVYDLGCGEGAFLANVSDYCKKKDIILKDLFGSDINAYAICNANILLSTLGERTHLVISDVVREAVVPGWNKCFVFPPFGLRLNYQSKLIKSCLFFNYAFRPNVSAEWIFIDRALSKRKFIPSGKVIAIVPPKALYSSTDKEYRDNLIKEGYLEGIIELPSGSLNYTGVKPIVLILSSRNKDTKILDASETLAKDSSLNFRSLEIPYEKILLMYKSAYRKSIDDLLEYDSLLPSKILLKDDIKKIKGIRLKELTENVFVGSQYTVRNFKEMFSDEKTGYRILTSSDIEDGMVEWGKLQAIKYNDVKFDKFAIRKNDIVITSKSSTVKTVVVDIIPKEKIIVTGGMIIVRPKLDKLNPTYLKIFLDSEIGRRSLATIQKGEYITTLNASDLNNLTVPIKPIKVQNEIANKYNTYLSCYLALKGELNKAANKLHNFYFEEDEK